MAKCPNRECDKNWQWDWCGDGYMTDENEPPKVTSLIGGSAKEIENDEPYVFMIKCPCGAILSFDVYDPLAEVSAPFNCPAWAEVNWEDHENNWKDLKELPWQKGK